MFHRKKVARSVDLKRAARSSMSLFSKLALFFKLALLLAVQVLVMQGAVAQQTDGLSSFRASTGSVFSRDEDELPKDLTQDYYERTLELRQPKLDAPIPRSDQRVEGPRILVKKIVFADFVEFPEKGITLDEVESLAEALRVDYMKEEEAFAKGYTRSDLEELAEYLDSVGAAKSADYLTAADLKGLVELVRRQNAARGLSYSDLEDLTNELTAFYRRKGLFLAQVQIPVQDVVDGVVTLLVQEGTLGEVKVEDNIDYKISQLIEPFENNLGDVVSHGDIEEGLYLLNDLPGLNVTGYFTASQVPGETVLNIRVKDESKWRATVQADNHGSIFSGDDRIHSILQLYNPAGIGDSLEIGYIRSNSFDQWDSDFGSELGRVAYELPVFNSRSRLRFSALQNEFLLGSDDPDNIINILNIEGSSSDYQIGYEYYFSRSRKFNLSGLIGVSDKETEIRADVALPDDGEHVTALELGAYLDQLSSSIQMLNAFDLRYQYGTHQDDVDALRSDDYHKVSLNTNSLFFVPMPFSDARSRLVVTSRWQYSEQVLPSFEQVSLGGVAGARGFTTRDFSADTAFILNTELLLNTPEFLDFKLGASSRLSDYLQVGLLADAAYGVLNNFESSVSNDWARISSAGVIFKIGIGNSFSANLSVAQPLMSVSTIENFDSDSESARVFADFSFAIQ